MLLTPALAETVRIGVYDDGKTKHGFMMKKKGGRPVPDTVFDFKLTEKGLEVTQ